MPKAPSKTITIVVVSDNHYFILLGALIKSIESNLGANTRVDLWVVEENVSKQNKKKLEASVDPNITSVHWKNLKDVIPAGFKLPIDSSSFPLNVYARFFIPSFLPASVTKVLYLDVDMIVLRDLNELWDIDLGDNYIAAVQDPRLLTFDNDWGGVKNYKELGFAPDTKYLNTGMMLINITKWKANNLTDTIFEAIRKNVKFANYPDQYGLNIVLANQWLPLDPRWNHFSTIDLDKPYLIHFVQRKPIYKSYNYNEGYKQLFYKYLGMTQWKNFKPIGESSRYIKKIKNILEKFTKKI